MSELSEFLLARIAEDEAAALEAAGVSIASTDPIRNHIARHDPARVLAECDAKRRIVERCIETGPTDSPVGRGWADARTQEIHETLMDEVLPCLALPYAAHPEYRQEWRP